MKIIESLLSKVLTFISMDKIFQSLSDTKTSLGPDEVKKAAFNLIMVGNNKN